MLIIIENIDSVEINKSYLNSFYELYLEAFPDENERELFDDIIKRVDIQKHELRTLIGLYIVNEQVAAGFIIDIYSNIHFHLIYLIVKPDARKAGVGKFLVTQEIIRIVTNINPSSLGLFLESNIPWKTKQDAFDPKIRINVFNKYGIKWIPIDYIQPSLSIEKKQVENLFLLFLPFKKEKTKIDYPIIIDFLSRFYHGLGFDPKNSKEFNQMSEQLSLINFNNEIQLKDIPMKESSKFKFNRVSICVQFSLIESKSLVKNPCEHFHSYETDLLSYHFQRDRPFTTRYQPDLFKHDIEIHFPETYTFHSEGRSYEISNERKIIKARLQISRTDFSNSENTVWSIVLMNQDDDYFSELEIIKLSSYFGSSQERTNLETQIKFYSPQVKNSLCFEFFVSEILGLKMSEKIIRGQDVENDISLGSGILQIDTAEITMNQNNIELDWEEFYQLMNSSLGKENAYLELNNKYDYDPMYQSFLNLLCGFALGIFDFNRMGFDEVVDTLQLLKGDNGYLLFVNRGVMMNLCHEDEMFEAVIENIGISPYLLIPNAVLNNNTFYLESTLNNLKSIDFDLETNDTLQKMRKTADNALNSGVISNVFHYKTEKIIFDFCSTERNHFILEDKINANIEELQQILDDRKSTREDRSDLLMTLLLTVMSCLQFQGIFQSISDDNIKMSWVYTITFSVTATILIYYLIKMKK